MRILYVDTSNVGHHIPYMSCLISSCEYESILAVPSDVQIQCKKRFFKLDDGFFPSQKTGRRKFLAYYNWLKDIKKIADEEKPDIIHFLMGDDFYRYFGVGLNILQSYKVVITLHWIRNSKLGIISTKRIAHYCNRIIVHTDYIKNNLESNNIKNITHIEYPCFSVMTADRDHSLKYFELEDGIPVIACIGNTREDKGLDIILEALTKIEYPFQLLIAGKLTAFNEEYIKKHSKLYEKQVHLCPHFLTNNELAMSLEASDIIALPYKYSFNGASGPLGEGVWRNKCIVGPSHGNLGNTIIQNHLGYTFETENSDSLRDVLMFALSNKFSPDEKYEKYRQTLRPDNFKIAYEKLYKEIT